MATETDDARGSEGPPAVHQVRIPVSGDADLAASLYRPSTAEPAPALVVYQPYLKDGGAGAGYDHAHRFFAAHGYACLLVDFRGTGGSSGRARPAFDPGEASDAAAAVEWVARQAWCDGNVGMWGFSYPAIMAMQTATLHPLGLRAIAPLLGNLDPYHDFVYPGGAPSLGALGAWGTTTLGLHLLPPPTDASNGRWFQTWRERLDAYEPYLIGLIEHPERDGYWESRAFDPAQITVPAFCIAGWHDLFCDGQVRAYEGMAGPKKLWVGPWMHVLPHLSDVHPVACLEQLLRWWDHWLRGRDTGIMDEPAVTLFAQGREAWRHDHEWPPADLKSQQLFLSAGGLLATDPAPERGEAVHVTDPRVGVTAGLIGTPTLGVGRPLDQNADEVASLAYTSAPLDETIDLVGTPVVTLTVAVEGGEEANLAVKLSAVSPTGASTLMTRGSVRHRPGPGARGQSAPGWDPVTIRLWPTCFQVPAGHRLRLAVAGADFPNLWPTATNPRIRVATGGEASVVTLPVASDQGVDGPSVGPSGYEHGTPLVFDAVPLWRTDRDHVGDAVTVTHGFRVAAHTPDRSGRTEDRVEVRGTVAAAYPHAARVEGEARFDMTLPGGSTVTVDASTWITADGLSMHGRVLLDRQPFFERTWTRSR